MSVTELLWWQVNTGSCYDLLPWSTKPLHDPILTNVYVAIWLHLATVSKHIEAWIKWGNRNDIGFCRFDIGYWILCSSLWHVDISCIMTRPRIGSNQRLSLTITHASRIMLLWISTDDNYIRIVQIIFCLVEHIRRLSNCIWPFGAPMQCKRTPNSTSNDKYSITNKYIYMYIHIYHHN